MNSVQSHWLEGDIGRLRQSRDNSMSIVLRYSLEIYSMEQNFQGRRWMKRTCTHERMSPGTTMTTYPLTCPPGLRPGWRRWRGWTSMTRLCPPCRWEGRPRQAQRMMRQQHGHEHQLERWRREGPEKWLTLHPREQQQPLDWHHHHGGSEY